MKHKNNIFFLLLILAGSAQAISFRDYYYGNRKSDIPSHKKEINAEVARGNLNLNNIGLTDLVGFDQVPGLNKLRFLYLDGNQITKLPENIFQILPGLRMLSLFNNPIPLTREQLHKEFHLPQNVVMDFKTPEQERIEQELFTAIGNADVSAARQRLEDIIIGRVSGPLFSKINISKIRDANGDNLLHAAIRDAAERIKVIEGMSFGLPEKEKNTVKKIQAEQKREINDRYMKIINAIVSCGDECVQEILFTPNAEGQRVVDAMIAKLGFNSPITQAMLHALIQEEEKEQRESSRVGAQANAANLEWSLAHQQEEKENEEKEQHEIKK